MKALRATLIGFSIIALSATPMLIVDSYEARKCQEEAMRMMALEAKLVEKLQAYKETNGYYPNSISMLSFTNSPREIDMATDLPKIRYSSSETNYYLGWVGKYGRQGPVD